MGRRRNTGFIIKLPKKGNLSLCKIWRGITLLSITSKVFSKVILNRISTALDPMVRKEQAGFRKGRPCGEHIFTLRQSLEQCQEWKHVRLLFKYCGIIGLLLNISIRICITVIPPLNLIYFEKDFDSIHRQSILCILRHYGITCNIHV